MLSFFAGTKGCSLCGTSVMLVIFDAVTSKSTAASKALSRRPTLLTYSCQSTLVVSDAEADRRLSDRGLSWQCPSPHHSTASPFALVLQQSALISLVLHCYQVSLAAITLPRVPINVRLTPLTANLRCRHVVVVHRLLRLVSCVDPAVDCLLRLSPSRLG